MKKINAFMILFLLKNVAVASDSTLEMLSSLKKMDAPVSKRYSEDSSDRWVKEQNIPEEVTLELKKYEADGQKLPLVYIQRLIQNSRKEIAMRQMKKLEAPSCNVAVKSEIFSDKSFVERYEFTTAEIDLIKKFESSLIRIEASGCVSSDSPVKAFNEYIKGDFQKAAINELKHSEINKNLICEKTEVFGIGKSQYCYNLKVNHDQSSDVFSMHTYNLTNAPLKEAEAPVYFREIHGTFKKLSGKRIAVSFVVHVRGADIPRIVRGMAKSKIEATQVKLFKLLDDRLK